MVQSWQYETPKNWESYVPQPEDYATTAEWEAALRAGSEDTSDVIGRYWDPIGQVWRGGKTTVQEQALVKFGDRDDSFNAGLGGANLRLNSSIGVNPDEARAAYAAYDEFGNPRIDPAVLALIERRMGIGPYEPPVAPEPINPAPGAPTPAQPGDDTPDARRYSDWWNQPPNLNEDTGQTDAGRHGAWWNSAPPPPGGGGDGRPPLAPPPDPVGAPGVDATARPMAATIDPRYPDWLLQANAQMRRRRPPMQGPMPGPMGGLGGY
jgi:hypothetical protein